MPAIRADGDFCADVEETVGRLNAAARDPLAAKKQIRGLGAHHELESGVGFGTFRHEIEKVPLRHEGNEFAACRQMREIGKRDAGVSDEPREGAQFLMRQP